MVALVVNDPVESRAFAAAALAQALVRPLVTFAFALALIVGFMMEKVSVEAFMSVVSSAIGYWYGVTRNDRRTTDDNGKPKDTVIEGTKTTVEMTKTERVEAPPSAPAPPLVDRRAPPGGS